MTTNMDPDDAKDLERYLKDRKKAEGKGNISEVAQLCNIIGELYSKYGQYETAIEYHSQERHLSQALNDKIGEAVACRKIGEAYCALGQYEEALKLQRLHFDLARECKNHIEEQRALATIGRTYLTQSETKTGLESTDANKKAERAFVKALRLCEEQLKDSIPFAEYMAMKCRLYLNIGHVYDVRGDVKQSVGVMERAKAIAEYQKLNLEEERHMCHASLASIYLKSGNLREAQRSVHTALMLSRKFRNKVGEKEMLVQAAMIHVQREEYLAAKHCIKKAHKLRVEDDAIPLRTIFKAVNTLQSAKHDLQTETDPKKIGKFYEVIADSFVDLGNSSEAVKNYTKVLEIGHLSTNEERAAIYVSLAQTFADMKAYESAILYYQQELQERKGNYEQSCRTLLNIAELEESKGSKYSVLGKLYLEAFENARKAKHKKLQVQTLKALIAVQTLYKQTEHLKDTEKKLNEVLKKNRDMTRMASDSSEDEDNSDLSGRSRDKDDDDDGASSLSELTVSEESEDEELSNLPLSRSKRSNIARRNEKGETPLHRACISGNLKKVKSLIAEGHPVNPRDYCGWLPIHEAANHGHASIVKFLLDSGAHINDRGGDQCNGFTPLIDAASNGNFDIVTVLVNHGANVMAKDNDGHTALDSLQALYDRSKEMMNADDFMKYNQVEALLKRKMGRSDVKDIEIPEAIPSKIASSSSSSSKPLSLRLPDLEDNFIDDSSDNGSDRGRQRSLKSKSNVNSQRKTKQPKPTKAKHTQQRHFLDMSSSEDESSANKEIIPHFRSSALPSVPSPSSSKPAEFYQSAINMVGSSVQKRLADWEDSSSVSNTEEFAERQSVKRKPALVTEEEDVGDSWLIEDIQTAKAKRKRNADVTSLLSTNSTRDSSSSLGKRRKTTSRHASSFSELKRRRNKLLHKQEIETEGADGYFGDTGSDTGSDEDITEPPSPCFHSSKPPHSATLVVNNSDVVTSSGIPLEIDDDSNGARNNVSAVSHSIDYAWDSDGDELLASFDAENLDPSSMQASQTKSQSAGNNYTHIQERLPERLEKNSMGARNIAAPTRREQKILSPPRSTHVSNQSRTAPSPLSQPSVLSKKEIASEKEPKATFQNTMKIKVNVEGQSLLISVPPADQDKTISWLAQQTGERYFAIFLLRPSLMLYTADGMVLCPQDPISTVVSDKDVLTASVTSWERPSLELRYEKSCGKHCSEPHRKVFTLLQACNLSGKLDLSDLGLSWLQLGPVFEALEGQATLTDLVLNGNRLSDTGVSSLIKLLQGLPILKSLGLETVGLSAQGLQELTMAVKKPDPSCLQSLTDLSLSHNTLHDLATDLVSSLVTNLPCLKALKLAACGLTEKFFNSVMCEVFRNRCLEQLCIAENCIGDAGLASVLGSIQPDVLTHLDMSHTRSIAASTHQGGNSFGDKLQKVFIGDSGGKDTVLQELNVSGCQLSEADVLVINRLAATLSHFKRLSISQNKSVTNKTIQKLLYLSVNSNLEEISARGCSIASPLGAELVSALKAKMAARAPLRKFVVSARGLKNMDPEFVQMSQIWQQRWVELAQVKLVGMALAFTVAS